MMPYMPVYWINNRRFSNRLSIMALLLSLFISTPIFSEANDTVITNRAQQILQNRGEVIVQFTQPSFISIDSLTQLVSIDSYKNNIVRAYISKKQLVQFLKLGIDFIIIEPSQKPITLKSTQSNIWNWDQYPTNAEYIAIMDSFAKAYPKLCKIMNIGNSVNSRKILFVRINSDTTIAKPSVMYSSTIHGDETTGFVLMLRLTEYLLKNYKNDSLVSHLIDSLDIWINPLANPDGTYFNGSDIWSATRNNANGADLNRNFPDPVTGSHPDGMAYQPETNAMMSLMQQKHFVLSANFHGGSEVVNYPWDSKANNHPDANWFKNISKEYADSAQNFGRSEYFTDVSNKGFTDGYAWYTVYGGRQDYITNFRQGREVTIELDETKTTPEVQLNNLWNYNYRSLLHYLEQGMYGIHGLVNDSLGNPVYAKILILSHDDASSFIYSDSISGAFYRLINEGNYSLQFSADGYKTKTIENVVVANKQTTYLNIQLDKGQDKDNLIESTSYSNFNVYPNPCSRNFYINCKNNSNSINIEIFDVYGRCIQKSYFKNLLNPIEIKSLPKGLFLIKLSSDNSKPLIIKEVVE